MTREERENALHCLKVMIDEEVCEECELYGTIGTDHCEADCVRVAIEALKKEPIKGHWVTRPHVFGVVYCSECGFELKIDNTNFCPNCGAGVRLTRF